MISPPKNNTTYYIRIVLCIQDAENIIILYNKYTRFYKEIYHLLFRISAIKKPRFTGRKVIFDIKKEYPHNLHEHSSRTVLLFMLPDTDFNILGLYRPLEEDVPPLNNVPDLHRTDR